MSNRIAKQFQRMLKRQRATELIDPQSLSSTSSMVDRRVSMSNGYSFHRLIPSTLKLDPQLRNEKTITFRTLMNNLKGDITEQLKSKLARERVCSDATASYEPFSIPLVSLTFTYISISRIQFNTDICHKASLKKGFNSDRVPTDLIESDLPLVIVFGQQEPGISRLCHALTIANTASFTNTFQKHSQSNLNAVRGSIRQTVPQKSRTNFFMVPDSCVWVDMESFSLCKYDENSEEALQRLEVILQPLLSQRSHKQRKIIPIMITDPRKDPTALHWFLLDYFQNKLKSRMNIVINKCDLSRPEIVARRLTFMRWMLDGSIHPSNGVSNADNSLIIRNAPLDPFAQTGKVFACSAKTGAGLLDVKRWLAAELGIMNSQALKHQSQNHDNSFYQSDPLTPSETTAVHKKEREKFRLRPFQKRQQRGPGLAERKRRQKLRKQTKKN